MTRAIQGTSREKIYQQLRLELLNSRRLYKRLSCMFKIINNEASNYSLEFKESTDHYN